MYRMGRCGRQIKEYRLRYEIKIAEIDPMDPTKQGVNIFSQVVDTNPIKQVSKAINTMRIRKPKTDKAATKKLI